jgi:adenosylhomocysteine nucleosidase
MEAGGLEDLISLPSVVRGDRFRIIQGELDGRRVALVITGMGRKAARRGTEALIAGHRPRCVVSTGFSGGLHADLSVGDIVLGQWIADREGGHIDVSLKADSASATQRHLHMGGLLCVDRLVRLPEQKRELCDRHNALAVDMESYAVAQVCRAERVPFLAVRIISDDANDELPEFLDRFALQPSLAGKTGAVIGSLLKQPGSLKSMYKMREQGLVLADRLARFLTSLVRELVPVETEDSSSTRP